MNEPDYRTPPADFPSRTGDTWEETKDRTAQTLREGEVIVRENLLSALVGVFAFGFLLGFLAHRPRPSFQERYLNAPLEDLGETLRALADKTADKADKGAGVAADLIHALADKLENAFKQR